MDKKVDAKYIHSSNLIFITVGLVGLFYLLSLVFFKSDANPFLLVLLNMGLIGGIGYLTRKGYDWSKYVVAILMGLYTIEASAVWFSPDVHILELVFLIPQIVLVFWSTLILFLSMPKKQAIA